MDDAIRAATGWERLMRVMTGGFLRGVGYDAAFYTHLSLAEPRLALPGAVRVPADQGWEASRWMLKGSGDVQS